MVNTIARVENLTVKFADNDVVRDVSLEIPARKITVLIGRSGSGKTTFLRAFNRLNEEFANCSASGKITVDWSGASETFTNIDSLALTALRLRVGMVFQTPNVLPVSIGRNIALPLEKLTRLSAQEIRRRVESSLTDVGLWNEVKDRLQKPADTLSGGQQQRLCLARTIALEPKILLLDEPTSSLDILAAREIEQLLIALAEQYTIIMVSHSLSQARRLADKLCVFNDGRVVKTFDNARDISEENLTEMIELL